jgi:hypothetical protein
VAERARLESVCTGNRTAGSNPALSAMTFGVGQAMKISYLTPSLNSAQSRRGRPRTRGGRPGGRRAGGRVRPRGGMGGRRDAGALASPTARGWAVGGPHTPRQKPGVDARNPALSAMTFGVGQAMKISHLTPSLNSAQSRRGRLRTRSGYESESRVVRSIPVGLRGKQGTRVPRDEAPRTSSGPEGSSDKGNASCAAVSPGSLLHHDPCAREWR